MPIVFFTLSIIIGVVLAFVARFVDHLINCDTCDSYVYMGRSFMAGIVQVAIWFAVGHYLALWLHLPRWQGYILPGAGLAVAAVFAARFFWQRRIV